MIYPKNDYTREKGIRFSYRILVGAYSEAIKENARWAARYAAAQRRIAELDKK